MITGLGVCLWVNIEESGSDKYEFIWLVVSTPLKKYESQWEGLSHILWKIKFMFETTNKNMNS
jgi:hypothetical protein